jgi:hypothetical protein
MQLFAPAIPKEAFTDAMKRLDSYCKQIEKKRRALAEDQEKPSRFFWVPKGKSVLLSEKFLTQGGQLTRRDSGKYEFDNGFWLLDCLDASRTWRRYVPAKAEKSLGVVFRHWLADETGIFRG